MARHVRRQGFCPVALLLVGCVCLSGGLAPAGDKAAKGKGDKATRVTPANYKKLKQGMTEKQVVAILGQPTETSKQDLGEFGTGKVLSWTSGGDAIAVLFREGKSIAHRGAFGGAGKAPPPKLTADAYAKVKFDMTEKEVLKILGKPTEVNSPADMPNVKMMVWISGDNRVTVTFRNGKVEASQASFVD
jgi:hypothetical protein